MRSESSESLLVVALFSRHETALEWARRCLEETYGPAAMVGEPFRFHHTAYYAPTMGADLLKQLLAFERLVPLDALATIKRTTIAMEAELMATGTFSEARPVNLDPGLLTLGKFMLATTKDQSHRIFLRDGIFAEVTLRFRDGTFEPWPWTYADYREPHVVAFLNQARDYFKTRT